MPNENLACLCDQLSEYVPLTIPTTDLQIDLLIQNISDSMENCCVSFTTYNQSSDPVVLTLVSPSTNCSSAQALVTIFTSSGATPGVWDLVECSIRFGTIDIEINGETDVLRNIQVNCTPACEVDKCCEDNCRKSCCERDRCSGNNCNKKCCTFYKSYKGKCCNNDYSSDDEDFNTCCDNTNEGCQPECQYPNVCFPDPKLNMKYGDYNPCESRCDEEGVGVSKLKTLPFKLPFKIRQYRGSVWYLIPKCNVGFLSQQISERAIPTSKDYYKIRADSIQEYTGITQNDPVFKFLGVSGMVYILKTGANSEFYLKLGRGQSTRFLDISNTIEPSGNSTIYKGFLEDLLKCE